MARVVDNPWFDAHKLRDCTRRFDLDLVVVYGSRARGDEHERSDLDVAVRLMKPHWSFEDELELANAVEDCLRVPLETQTVVINSANPLLMFNIAEDGRLIYERHRDQWALQRWRAAQEYRTEEVRRIRYGHVVHQSLCRLAAS